MNKEQYERVLKIFHEAADLESGDRQAFLERACGDDKALRRNVERLLAQDGAGDPGVDFESSLGMGYKLLAGDGKGETRAAGPPPVPFHDKIGQYRIQDKIAEGGMGAVYLAEQDHPRRPVALKMIRPGMISADMLRRFKFEAELLGRLQHPGIARIFEAGEAETQAGTQPFFAMEYIEGVELRRYIREHDLDIPARMELMARACDAVNHAHQKGIVHRDLKPENILVVEEATTTSGPSTSKFARLGQPKVLDFGVARAMNSDVQITTMHTDMGQIIGTLTYMSPEQVSGDPRNLDTRSDLYALGVILYELLAGRPPHDLKNKTIPEAARIIRDDEPTRIGSVNTAFRGDIDAILCKAMEKDQDRRYASAAALAEDIRRYLADQPITARPPTFTYQLSRFIRRNKVIVASALAALLCLVGGLALALISQREEARQRALAERQKEEIRRSAYGARIQAAMAYSMAGENRSMHDQLSATPPDLRGWECDYLFNSTEADLYFFAMKVLRAPHWETTPGESRLLFPVAEKTLRLYDCVNRTWSDHACPEQDAADIGAVALLPGGRSALWGDARGHLSILDLEGNQAPRRVWKAEDPIEWISISPDGVHAAVACSRSAETPKSLLYLLDLQGFRVRSSLGEQPRIYALAFSPDGSRLATAMRSGEVHLRVAASLEHLRTFQGHAGPVDRVCFSPTGLHLASSGIDRTIRIWSLESGRQQMLLGPMRYWAETIAFHPDGKTLISGHAGARIRRWNLETGECESFTSGQSESDPGDSAIQQVGITSEDDLIHAVGLDGVYIRPLREPFPKVLRHEMGYLSYVYHVDFSPSGRLLVSSGWDGTVRIWDVATGRLITVLHIPGQSFWAKFAPDGKWLLTCSQAGYTNHTLKLWSVSTLRQERELEFKHTHPCGLFVPRSGAFLLGAGSELWVVDPLTLTVKEKRITPAPVWSLALSPDGTRLSCGMANGQFKVLDAGSLEELNSVNAHEQGIEAMVFSPDGKRLATGGAEDEIRIFDASSGEELLRFETPGARNIFSLRFTPDGRRLLSGSRRISIGVWEAPSGLELVRLYGHEDYVHALALSPDGRILASASGDNTVRLWDNRPLKERVRARDHLLAAERTVRGKVMILLEKFGSIDRVLGEVEADPMLTPLEKYAAWNVVHLSKGR